MTRPEWEAPDDHKTVSSGSATECERQTRSMSLLKISRMGHPVLREQAVPVGDPTDPVIKMLAANMIATMHDAEGVGLAAPQVYERVRVIVLRVPADCAPSGEREAPPDTVLVNPSYDVLGNEMELGWEGCLSIPGLRGLVPRHARIWYRGFTIQGEPIEGEATGFYARVLQHEVDHLDGILYLDRMTDMRTLTFESEWKHFLAASSKGDTESGA